MMKSEFIDRTGFEPTAAEYEEIELEYMGCGDDKDKFCSEWKKNGGIQRLCRMRARRIEELEAELIEKDKLFDSRVKGDDIRYHELYERDMEKMRQMEAMNEAMRKVNFDIAEEFKKMKARCEEAERKLAVLKEAFAIIGTGKEEKVC